MVIAKTQIYCETCRKSAMHPVRKLVGLETATCPFCSAPTNISGKRAHIHALAERYRALEDFFDTCENV